MTHTGLLGRVVLMALIAGVAQGSPAELCNECYQACYEEEVSSLSRVHITSNPDCVNLSHLVLYEKNKRVYWIAQNTATFRQPLLGECPIEVAWLCFECDAAETSSADLVKRKEMVKMVRKIVCYKYLYESTGKEINPFWNTFQGSSKPLGLISSGNCIARVLKPIFLLPKETGSSLGVPIYNDLGEIKQNRESEIEIEKIENCKSQVRIPKSVLNKVIWLQAALKIKNSIIRDISNEIKRLACVNNQDQTPTLDPSEWENLEIFRKYVWEKVVFLAVCVLGRLLFLLCLFICFSKAVFAVQTNLKKPRKVTRLSNHDYQSAQEIYTRFKTKNCELMRA